MVQKNGKSKNANTKKGVEVMSKVAYNATNVSVADDGTITIKFAPHKKGNPSKTTAGNTVHHWYSGRIAVFGKNANINLTLTSKPE